MSLIIRMPLNKSLTKNIGLNDVAITPFNTSIVLLEEDITKDMNQFLVAEFNGSDSYISIPNLGQYLTGLENPFSICLWIYHNSNTTKRGIIFGNYNLTGAGGGINIEIKTDNTIRFWWKGSPDWSTTVTLSLKTWTHIAIVYTGSKVLVYKNGILSDTRNGVLSATSITGNMQLGRDARTGTTAFLGYMSDFRFYNHALSAREIYEISQGLMLHYKLDDKYLANINPNLYDTLELSTLTVNISVTKIGDVYQITTRENTTYHGTSGRMQFPLTLLLGKESSQFYLQFKYKVISGDADFTSFDWCDAYPVTIVNKVIADDYTHVVIKLPVLSVAAPSRKYNSTYKFLDINSLKQDSVIQMWDIKFEEAEEWSTYSRVGEVFTTNIIDYSGFERDAAYILGTLETTNDAEKYRYSTTLNGSAGVQSEEFLMFPTMTYMGWVKIPTTSAKFLFDARKTVSGFSSGRGVQPIYISSMSSIQVYSSTGGSNNYSLSPAMPSNNWFHIAVTTTENGNSVYINGNKVLNGTTAKGFLMIAPFTLGMRFTYTSLLKGQVNDIRVYRTALSDDLILHIYLQTTSIDNHDNLYAYEFVENSSIKIKKNAILESNKFLSENNSLVKFYKNKNIQATNIIEI